MRDGSEAANASSAPLAASPSLQRQRSRVVHEGIAVELSVSPQGQPTRSWPEAEIFQGADATIQFRITDTVTGMPATALQPAAWIHRSQPSVDCGHKIGSFLSGSLSSRADVDLNVYYVLALNDEASISIVDPLFGYGGSKLLTMVPLTSPGEDWALSQDASRLFVTMPLANKVAAVDTGDWRVLSEIDAAQRPSSIALSPDGARLWVGSDGVSSLDMASGVTVVDVTRLEKITTVPTGVGHHEICFSANGAQVWVTNGGAGTVSVIDAAGPRLIKDIEVGAQPVSIAFSQLGNAVYVVSSEQGLITVIDGDNLEVTRRLHADPGLGAIRFAPGGRLGFVVNTKRSLVHIIDVATCRIVQTADVEKSPVDVAFTETVAYIRSLESEVVLMIPLGQVDEEGAPVPVIDFPAGQEPLGKASAPSLAAAIVPAPGGTSVLVANPGDGSIYYYREGMAAPMGSFQNYGRQPRAVLVVDRSLKEVQPGVYETNVRLDLHGQLDVAFFLDSPRISHCFSIDVTADPSRSEDDQGPPVNIEPILEGVSFRAGQVAQLRLRVTDPATAEAREGIADLGVLVASTGTWQERLRALAQGNGVYAISVSPPWPGTYFVSVQCPSLGLDLNDIPPLTFRVKAGLAAP